MPNLSFTNADITDNDGSDGIVEAGGFRFQLTSGTGTLSFLNEGFSFVESFPGTPFNIQITRLDGSTFSIDGGNLIYQGGPDFNVYAVLSDGTKTGTYGDYDFSGNSSIAVMGSGYNPATSYTLSDKVLPQAIQVLKAISSSAILITRSRTRRQT